VSPHIEVRYLEDSMNKGVRNHDTPSRDFLIMKGEWATSVKVVDRCHAASVYRHIGSRGSVRQVDFNIVSAKIPMGGFPIGTGRRWHLHIGFRGNVKHEVRDHGTRETTKSNSPI